MPTPNTHCTFFLHHIKSKIKPYLAHAGVIKFKLSGLFTVYKDSWYSESPLVSTSTKITFINKPHTVRQKTQPSQVSM